MEGTSRQVEKLHFSRDMSSDDAKGEIAQISTTPNNQINIKQSQQSAENKNLTKQRTGKNLPKLAVQRSR